MPSALHPRSRQTFSLFTTTLAVSFLVVALPHILPCPVPRTSYADSIVTDDTATKRQLQNVRLPNESESGHTPQSSQHTSYQEIQEQPHRSVGQRLRPLTKSGDFIRHNVLADEVELIDNDISRSEAPRRARRECPVPKPGGLMGQVMGFTQNRERKPSGPWVIEVQPRQQRRKKVISDPIHEQK